jgi:hypothetical protein
VSTPTKVATQPAPAKTAGALDISKPPAGLSQPLIDGWDTLPEKVKKELHILARTGK